MAAGSAAPAPDERRGLVACALLALGAAAVATATAVLREPWLDEAHSIFVTSLPPGEMLAYVRGDVHPPLYFLVLAGWQRLFGFDVASARALSIIVSAAAVPLTYWSARAWGMSPRARVVAAAVIGLNPALLVASTEARMYPLLIALLVLSLGSLGAVYRGALPGTAAAAGTGLLLAALFYSHYVGLFLAAGLLAAGCLIGGNGFRQRIRWGLIAGGVFLALTAPWLPTLMRQRETKELHRRVHVAARQQVETLDYRPASDGTAALPADTSVAPARALVENVASILGVFPPRDQPIRLVLAVPFLVAGIAALSLMWRGDKLALTALIAGTALIVGVGLLDLLHVRRYLLGVGVLSAFVGGRAVDVYAPRFRTATALTALGVAVISGLGAVRTMAHPPVTGIRRVAETLRSYADPGALVVVHGLWGQPFVELQLKQTGAALETTGFPLPVYAWWKQQPFKGWGSPVIFAADVSRFTERMERLRGKRDVWIVFFESEMYDVTNRLEAGLRERFPRATPYFLDPAVRDFRLLRLR